MRGLVFSDPIGRTLSIKKTFTIFKLLSLEKIFFHIFNYLPIFLVRKTVFVIPGTFLCRIFSYTGYFSGKFPLIFIPRIWDVICRNR